MNSEKPRQLSMYRHFVTSQKPKVFFSLLHSVMYDIELTASGMALAV
jgi:hypothetical protein